MRPWQRIITATSGITIAIGTFVASGLSPFYANEGLHVSLRFVQANRSLEIMRAGPDLNCWIRLHVPDSTTGIVARLSNGEKADVRFHRSDPGWIYISKIPKKGETWPQHLKWTSGLTLTVTPLKTAPDRWDIYPDQGTPDSSTAGKRRAVLVVIAVISLIVAIAAAIINAFPEEPAKQPIPTLSAQTIIDGLTNEIEGANEHETKVMRHYVKLATVLGARKAMNEMKRGTEQRLALSADLLVRKRFEDLLEALQKVNKKFSS
jgi:hypothetical protein